MILTTKPKLSIRLFPADDIPYLLLVTRAMFAHGLLTHSLPLTDTVPQHPIRARTRQSAWPHPSFVEVNEFTFCF